MKFLLIYVPNLRFREFSLPWHQIPIKDLLSFQNGINGVPEQYGKGIKYISVGDILNNDYITYDKIVGSIDISQETLKNYSVTYGDILFQRSSEIKDDIGRTNVYLDKDNTATFGGFVIRGKKIGDYNPSFFSFLLKSPSSRKSIVRLGAGAQHYNIGQENIKTLSFYFPNEIEQVKIANLLSKIDERIQTQIKIINALDSQRKCIFLKVHRAQSLKKIKIFELGRMIAANNLSKDELSIKGNECILYGELFTKYNLYIDNVISKTEKIDNAIISSGNDILFPTSTTVDAFSLIKPSALIKKGVILGGDMFSIKLKDDYNPIYISCLINFIYRKKFASKTQGSTIIHLHYSDIKNEVIEICDYEIQCKIANLIESITEKLKVEEELLNLLYIQKSYLLQNMFI